MIKQIFAILLIFLMLSFVSAEVGKITAYVVASPENESSSNPSSQMVGNDRDSHGCIPSAGYSWCEEKNKCLRIWEENCSSTSESSGMRVMKEPATARIQEELGLNCTQANCQTSIKQIETTQGTKTAFEVAVQKQVRLFGFIKTQMKIQTYIDSETGFYLGEKKPWWHILARE